MTEASYAQELESLMSTSLVLLMPELAADIHAAGRLQVFSPQTRVVRQDDSIDNLIIPLDASVRLVFTTGRIGEENMLERSAPLRPIALRDMLDGKGYPFSIETESKSAVVLLPKKLILDLTSGKPKLRRSLSAIASSVAVERFAKFLLQRKLTVDVVVTRLHALNLEPSLLPRRKKLVVQKPSIVFIQSGQLVLRKQNSEEASSAEYPIEAGGWFLFHPGKGNVDIVAQSNVYTQILELANTVSPLDPAEQALFDEKGVWSPDFAFFDTSKEQLNTLHPINGKPIRIDKLSRYYNGIDPKTILVDSKTVGHLAATISNLSRLLGDEVNVNNVEIQVKSAESLSMVPIAEIIERSGYITRGLACDFGQLSRQVLPAILFLSGRPVILLKKDFASVTVLDAHLGILKISRGDFEDSWNRRVIEVMQSPFDAAAREGQRRGYANRPDQMGFAAMKFLLDEFSPVFRNQALLNIFGFSLAMLFPILLHQFIDQVLISRDPSVFLQFLFGFVGLLVFQGLARFADHVIDQDLRGRIFFRLGSTLYRQFLQLPATQFSDLRSSDASVRTQQIEYLTSVLMESRVATSTLITNTAVILVVLYFLAWKVGLIMTVFVGASLIVALKILKGSAREAMGSTELKREFQTRMAEFLRGFLTVKFLGAEKSMREKIETAAFDSLHLQTSMSGRWFGIDALIGGLAITSICLSLLVSMRGFMDGSLSPGSVMALIFYVGMMIGPVTNLVKLLSTQTIVEPIYRLVGGMIRPDLDYSYETGATSKAIAIDGRIRFERVSYRYTERVSPAVNDISFSINRGDVVVIVGETGSGKSTLARLLAARVRPAPGKIYFDDVDSRIISATSLREQIILVEQTPALFSGSIIANIAYGDDTPDFERASAAAKEAGLISLIDSLPGGFDFVISSQSAGLSVGQKQQIALARALYQRPKVLIIDESTAHLDPVAQQLITDNLSALMKDKTVILVAHHLAAARSADKILVLKAGVLVEQGNHSTLLKKNGEYAQLYRRAVGAD